MNVADHLEEAALHLRFVLLAAGVNPSTAEIVIKVRDPSQACEVCAHIGHTLRPEAAVQQQAHDEFKMAGLRVRVVPILT